MLDDYVMGNKFSEMDAKQKRKILTLVKQIVNEQEKENQIIEQKNRIVQQGFQAQEQADNKRSQAGLLATEFENTMEYGEKATSIAEKVMTITGALSSLTMT